MSVKPVPLIILCFFKTLSQTFSVFICLFSFALFSGCSKTQSVVSAPGFTEVHFSSNNKLTFSTNLKESLSNLPNLYSFTLAPVLSGSLIIYAVEQSGSNYTETLFLSDETSSGTLTLPNGNFRFYSVGYGNAFSYGSITNSIRCALVNSGQAIKLNGQSTTINVHLTSADCTNNDEFFTSDMRSLINPVSLDAHSCAPSYSFDNCPAGLCSACISGDIKTYRIKLLNYRKIGNSLTQKTNGLQQCLQSATPTGNVIASSSFVPTGTGINSPFIVEVGAYTSTSTDCSSTPNRTYTFLNGLYEAYNTTSSFTGGNASLGKDTTTNPAHAHLYLYGGSNPIDQVDDDNDATGGFAAGTHNATQWDSVNSWLELTAGGQIAGSGDFISRVIDTGATSSTWTTISWVPQRPLYKELPNNAATEVAYSAGNASMSNNIMLLHMNEASWNGTASEVVDSSGQANHGVAIGGATTNTNGRFNGAGIFDGIDDAVSISNSVSLGITTNFSTEFWFKPSTTFSNMSDYNMGLLDKGVFQFFLNKADGKLHFTLQDNTALAWTTSTGNPGLDSPFCFAEFNGYFYAGNGSNAADGDIIVCNPATAGASTVACDNAADWTLSYDGGTTQLDSLTVYKNKLYAGTGYGAGDGNILVCNPSAAGNAAICDNAADWTTSYDGAGQAINALAAFNGYLYAGESTGAGSGTIRVCNPVTAGDANTCDDATDWSVSKNGVDELKGMVVFNGKLYATVGSTGGQGSIHFCNPAGGGNVSICDNAADWAVSYAYDGTHEIIYNAGVFNGKMYMGMGLSAGDGDIYMCTPSGGGNATDCDNAADWSMVFDGTGTGAGGFATYDGKLYVAAETDDIYACDPTVAGNVSDCDNSADWTLSRGAADNSIGALGVYKGYLYAGEAYSGDIFVLGNSMSMESTTVSWSSSNWYHIATTYDGSTARLYINGVQQDSKSTAFTMNTNTNPLLIGKMYGSQTEGDSAETFAGILDEIAIYNTSVLTATEVLDHYKRGAVRLKYQVRSCDDAVCAGETFLGSDGTGATFYSELINTNITLPSSPFVGIINNRYFQYKAYFETDDPLYSPELKSINIGPAH